MTTVDVDNADNNLLLSYYDNDIILKNCNIKPKSTSSFYDYYSYEKRQKSFTHKKLIKNIIKCNHDNQNNNNNNNKVKTTTMTTTTDTLITMIFGNTPEIKNLIFDYSIGSAKFWKCYFNDVILSVNELHRPTDTQLSYFTRTRGISSSRLFNPDDDTFNLKWDTSYDWTSSYYDIYERLMTPSVYLLECVPDEYFSYTYEDESTDMYLNKIKILILEYIGYDYWFKTP